MIAWFRYICLIVSLIITLPELLSAQRLVSQRQEDVEAGLLYNESVYILSNYSCLSSNSPENFLWTSYCGSRSKAFISI